MAAVLVLVAMTVIAVIQGVYRIRLHLCNGAGYGATLYVSRPRLAPAPVPPDDSAFTGSRVEVYQRLRILPDTRAQRSGATGSVYILGWEKRGARNPPQYYA